MGNMVRTIPTTFCKIFSYFFFSALRKCGKLLGEEKKKKTLMALNGLNGFDFFDTMSFCYSFFINECDAVPVVF